LHFTFISDKINNFIQWAGLNYFACFLALRLRGNQDLGGGGGGKKAVG
jgi:hypothetical protein